MKTKILLCAVVLFAGIAFNSCKPSDEELQKQVAAGITAVSSAVSSEVKKGEVTLTGVVNSEELKDAAQAAAKSVKGISNVINNIEVKLPEPPKPVINPDDVVQKTIATAITAGGAAFSKVVVAVKDSIVTLTGDVKRTDLKKLMQVVNEAKPKKITNSLTIK